MELVKLGMVLAAYHDCNNFASGAMNYPQLLHRELEYEAGPALLRLVRITKKFENHVKDWSKLGVNPSLRARFDILKNIQSTAAEALPLARAAREEILAAWIYRPKCIQTCNEIVDCLEKIIIVCQILFDDKEFQFSDIAVETFLGDFVSRQREISRQPIYYVPSPLNGEKLKIVGKQHLIELALINILTNAVNHGKTPLMTVRTVPAGQSHVEIVIKNEIGPNGISIDPYWLEEVELVSNGRNIAIQRIFVEYFTTSKSTERPHGIGMKLIRAYLEPMGIEVKIESNRQSTVYKLLIPLKGGAGSRTPSGRIRFAADDNGAGGISLSPPNGYRLFEIEEAV